jgi:hypothetical protein
MHLRQASFEVVCRELRPHLLYAVRHHPTIVDLKLLQGNPVTARDYAKRVIKRARQEGIGNCTADRFRRLAPRIRVYYTQDGIALGAIKRKSPDHDYFPPLNLKRIETSRWPILMLNPTRAEILNLAAMLKRGALVGPLEIRTKESKANIQKLIGSDFHVFTNGKTVIVRLA